MAEFEEMSQSFGAAELLSAAASGLLLFQKKDLFEKEGDRYVCTLFNEVAVGLTGRQNLLGEDWQTVVGIDNSGALDSPPTLTFEIFFKLTGFWCKASTKPVNDQSFLCTFTDITGQKDLELKSSQMADMLNRAEGTMKFGSWTGHTPYDKQSKDWWSDGLYDLLGYSPKEARSLVPSGELYFGHVHPDDRDSLKLAVERSFTEKKAFKTEYRLRTNSGEEKFVVSRGMYRAADQSGPATSYGNAFDMTPIRKIRTELERKVNELNRSNFDLEQFAYVASHDLQEPLRKIVSFGERLESKSKGALNEESTLYLSRILSASRRMQDMIANLLEFSRVARSRDGFVITDLEAVMNAVLSDLEVTIQSTGAHITIDPLPEIKAIPTQIAQLFQNLLTNSLKFARACVTPVITVRLQRIDEAEQLNYGLPANRQYLRLLFSDNGIGFANQDSSRIFTLFQRLRGRSEYEGAGIGLAVCKKVVENHSGVIMASAKTDEGALFTIVLPFENP